MTVHPRGQNSHFGISTHVIESIEAVLSLFAIPEYTVMHKCTWRNVNFVNHRLGGGGPDLDVYLIHARQASEVRAVAGGAETSLQSLSSDSACKVHNSGGREFAKIHCRCLKVFPHFGRACEVHHELGQTFVTFLHPDYGLVSSFNECVAGWLVR